MRREFIPRQNQLDLAQRKTVINLQDDQGGIFHVSVDTQCRLINGGARNPTLSGLFMHLRLRICCLILRERQATLPVQLTENTF